MTEHQEQELLDAYIDGELPETDARRMELHIGQCAECAEWLKEWMSVSKSVFRPVQPGPTEFFVSRVMALVRGLEKPAVGDFFRNAWRWSALVLVALAIFLIATSPSETPAPSTRTLLMADAGMVSSSPSAPVDELLDVAMEDI